MGCLFHFVLQAVSGAEESEASEELEVCVNSTDPLSSVVTSIAPKCFEACPELCSTVDALLSVYLDTGDVVLTERKGCDLASSFERVWEEDNMKLCRPVLQKGRSLGLPGLPSTNESFVARCEALSRSGHHDAKGDNGAEDPSSDASRMGVVASATLLALFAVI